MIYKKSQTFGDSTLVCIVFFPLCIYSNGCYCANTSNVCFPLLCICNYVSNYLYMYVYSLLCITVSRKWRLVRSKPGPGCLHSQCAVKFLSVMMLFGGERDGQALNDMWRFHFGKINRILNNIFHSIERDRE